MVELAVVNDDILKRRCDLLLLKHAEGFHGVDAAVSERLGFMDYIPRGRSVFVAGQNIGARQVLYIGVEELRYFR
ncbi:MAG: hypothetical protein AB7H90_20600 [Alphaproteobacteria bacterium]